MIQKSRHNRTLSAGFWAYNLILSSGAIFGAPCWAPLVAAVAKRRHTFGKRLRLYSSLPAVSRQPVWIQALSVGEVRSAEPLVNYLADSARRLVVSASTHSGFELARELFSNLVSEVEYFPYDFIFSIRHAVQSIRPSAVVIVETDIWPNFLLEMNRLAIPVHLVNGRISDRSFGRFKRFTAISKHLFNCFNTICVQTADDAERLLGLGVRPSKVKVTGNFKFDLAVQGSIPADRAELRQRWNIKGDGPLIVAGSTHPGEEKILIQALGHLLGKQQRPWLMVAPRDVRRARSVAESFRAEGFSVDMMGLRPLPDGKPPHVVVLDKIGILRRIYCLADLAIIGGSFVTAGGHNPLEPAAFGCPVVFGHDMSDFRQVAEMLIQAEGAIQVKDPFRLETVVAGLLADPSRARQMGHQGQKLVKANQGAVEKTAAALNLDHQGR